MTSHLHSLLSLRQQARTIFQAGVAAANPYQAVQRAITVAENHIALQLDVTNPQKIRIGRWTKIHLIALGKAACTMAKAVQDCVPAEWLADTALVITNYENLIDLPPFTVIGAGHPLPDAAGLQAAQQVIAQLKQAQQGELVLVLISGGGSALLPAPVEPVTLAEKMRTTDLLLSSSATITEINCVRKHLSQLKGGHLTRLACPADVHALILSDVLGDDLSTIASGVSVADNSRYSEAIEILIRYAVWDKIPLSVQQVLVEGQAGQRKETPKSVEAFFKHSSHVLIGSNALSVQAAMQSARQEGYQTHLYNAALTGIAREQATHWVQHIKALVPLLKQPTAFIAGGETTVNVTGSGKGGRNQELALAFAIAAKKDKLLNDWVFLSGGTDGKDGETDAAGGLVDSQSIERIKNARFNPTNRLNNNDSYTALNSSGDLLITGATGTNVADLSVLLIYPLK